MSRKKIHRILIEAVLAAVLIFLLVFFLGFKVTRVEVEGNRFYTDDEIKKMVLDAPIAQNSILAMLIKTEEKTKDAKLIDNVTLKRKNRNTLTVRVKEKQMIGYIKFKGKFINFDRQGIIRIITDKAVEGVPFIEGLNVKEAKVEEKLKGVNTKKLNTILSVGKMLEKTEQKPDRLLFNDMKQLVLYYGNIEVRLGDDENMDDKMNRLIGILPELAGMEGILHLENITENTETVVFDNAAESEEDEEDAVEAQDGQSDAGEEDSDSSRTKNKDREAQDNQDGTSREGDRDVSQDSDEEGESADENELDYSDGSDAADGRNR